MCSVPFGLVALGLVAPGLGRVAALNDGTGGHGRLGRVARLRRVLGGIARLGRRGWIRPDDLALGRVAGLDVALLDRGLDDGRRVDDGGRVGQLRLSFFLVLLVEHPLAPLAHEGKDAARDAAADDDEDDEDDGEGFRSRGLVILFF